MHTVVLDAGLERTASPEERRISSELAALATNLLGQVPGVQVEQTRPEARARLGRVFVSLDFNRFSDSTVQGTETWVHPQASAASRTLARRLQAAVQRVTGHRDRGVRTQPLAVLAPFNGTPTAAAQVEISFYTDPREAERLLDQAYQQRIAKAVAKAILAHLRSVYTPEAGLAPWEV